MSKLLKISCLVIAVLQPMASYAQSHISKVCSGEVVAIRNGVSSGNCLKNCWGEVTFSKGKMQFADDERKVVVKIDDLLWYKLQKSANEAHLKCGTEIIGCPDCSDEGAEWIELEMKNGTRKKITFSSSQLPKSVGDEFAMQLNYLREWIGTGISIGSLK